MRDILMLVLHAIGNNGAEPTGCPPQIFHSICKLCYLKRLVDRKAIEFTRQNADLKPSPPRYEVVTLRRFTWSLSHFCNRRIEFHKTRQFKNSPWTGA